MSNQQQQQSQQQGQTAHVAKEDLVEPIFVLCRVPFTALMPTGEKVLGAAGSMPANFGLRFERGINVLAGHVDLGAGVKRFVTLEELPPRFAGMKEPERAKELQRLLADVRRSYPQHFTREDIERNDAKLLEGRTWPSAAMATFQAIGSLKELQRLHYQALREAASKGGHKPSLLALLHHPDTPDDIKQLVRHRLTAWNQDMAV